ncbi:MAG: DUF4136 domain-containing protein [Puniceicoccaceae bacterium]
MKKITIISLLSIALAFLFGCESTPKIQSEYNDAVDFSAYKTFAIMPLPTNIPGADPGIVLRTGRFVQEEVVAQLVAAGYTKVAKEDCDFAVNLTGKVVPKTDITDWGYMHYPTRGWYGAYSPYYYTGSNVTVDQYEEGTLIIEIYDAKTKEMAWVGWGVGRRKSDGPDYEKLRAAIAGILAEFPPAGM